MDRAGRHRRLAFAIPVFVVALLVLAIGNLANRHLALGSWLPHLMLASSLAWMLSSLLGTGRLIDHHGTPHPSLALTAFGLGGFAGSGLAGAGQWCCQLVVLTGGVGAMAYAVVLFVLAERGGRNPAMPEGRLLLSIGAALVAQATLGGAVGRLLDGQGGSVSQAVGLGLLGTACVLLAVHEGRLALRLLRSR